MPSRYSGSRFEVLRLILGTALFQPKPRTPFPPPESYASDNCGPKPDRPALAPIGTENDAVPVTGLVSNFSPIPLIAPPPLGTAIASTKGDLLLEASLCGCVLLGFPSSFSYIWMLLDE